jgi:hypothetical protein
MTKRPRHASKPAPVEQAILWKPLDDAYHLLASMLKAERENYVPFATQSFLVSLAEQMREAGDEWGFGLILGRLYRCSRTNVRYTVTTEAAPLRGPVRPDSGAPDIREMRQAVAAQKGKGGQAILGWYCRRGEVGPRMSHADEDVHASCFPESWQITLVLASAAPFTAGGFFVYSRKAERSCQVPFFELIEGKPSKKERKRTVLEWSNYVAGEPIRRAGATGDEVSSEPVGRPSWPVLRPLDDVLSRMRGWVGRSRESR